MGDRIYRALLIGNSTFPEDPHNLPELKGPVNDLTRLHDALSNEETGLFDQKNIRLLPERTKAEATRAIEEFLRKANREDLLLLYYSGHGKQDEFGNLFLCARDTRTDLLHSSAISDLEINGMIRTSLAQTFVIVLDCCHAGAFKGGELPENLKGKGRFLLTSSQRGQPSNDGGEFFAPSAFTKYLAEGLRDQSLDTNGDGYVSLHDLYLFTLDKLSTETQQKPQLDLDKTIGDVAVARGRVAVEPKPQGPDRPVLGVSESRIDILNVGPGEELRSEVIDVFNKGKGELTWTVESLDEWISVEKSDDFFSMRFDPSPGDNRGSVRVRAGHGETKTIRIYVQVKEHADAPQLVVSTTKVDFGTVSVGAASPSRTIQLINAGGGSLNARASTPEQWIDLRDYGEALELSLDTTVPGERRGVIVVNSDGGNSEIKVIGRVERGPVLGVSPGALRFGQVHAGTSPRQTITVSNDGQGQFSWDFGHIGEFFVVERTGDSLNVTITGHPGRHVGSIWVRSNGGEQTLDVTAEIVPRRLDTHAAAGIGLIGALCILGGAWLPFSLRDGSPVSIMDMPIPALSTEAVAVGILGLFAALLPASTVRLRALSAGLLLGLGTGSFLTRGITITARLDNEVLSKPGPYVMVVGALLLVAAGIVLYRGLDRKMGRQPVLLIASLLLFLGTGLRFASIFILNEWSSEPVEGWNTALGTTLLVVVMVGVALLLRSVRGAAAASILLGFSVGLGIEVLLRSLRFVIPVLEKWTAGNRTFTIMAKQGLVLTISMALLLVAAASAARVALSKRNVP